MKQHMMIVGCKIVSDSSEPGKRDGLMNLTLIPLTTVKVKQPGLMDLASGGMEKLMQKAQNLAPKEANIHITIGEWIDCKYRIGCHVTVDLLPDKDTGGLSYD